MAMYGFDTYIFIDEDDKILEERDFRNEEVAVNNAILLMRKKKKIIGCYKEIAICDPVDFTKTNRGWKIWQCKNV
jgi:hypothetical protein